MNGLVLVIGDLTMEQEDLIRTHLTDKGILDRFARCPEVQMLDYVVEEAGRMARPDDDPESDEGDFYQKAFANRIGEDLSKVVAIVTTEALEEALYQFNDDNPRFFGCQCPTFIIRPQQSFWIDEK